MSSWKQVLATSGMKEADFGVTFRKNVDKITKYSAAIGVAEKNLAAETDEKKKKKIQKNIDSLTQAVADLDKKLTSNINRAIKNPDAYKASKERVASFTNKKKQDGGTVQPAKSEPQSGQSAPATTSAAASTSQPAAAQPAAAKPNAKPNTPPSPAPPKPVKTEEKKGSNTTNIVIGCVIGVLTLGVGAWLWFGRRK